MSVERSAKPLWLTYIFHQVFAFMGDYLDTISIKSYTVAWSMMLLDGFLGECGEFLASGGLVRAVKREHHFLEGWLFYYFEVSERWS